MEVYRFGPFSLNVSERWLARNGKLIALPNKLFDILTLFVRNENRLVTKDHLMRAVWPDTAVEDSNLTVSMSRIRKVLRERKRQPKYIVTVPGRGYRFIANVSREVQCYCASPATTLDEISCGLDLPSDLFASVTWVGNASDSRAPRRDGNRNRARREYLKGRYFWSKHKKRELELAVINFRNAIQTDPDAILAYAAAADCYLRLTTNYFIPDDLNDENQSALEVPPLDEISPDTQRSLNLRHEWDVALCQREFKRASELNHRFPSARLWRSAYIYCEDVYEHALEACKGKRSSELNAAHDPMFCQNGSRLQLMNVTPAEAVQVSCIVARDQIQIGNIEASYLVLQPWYKLGEWPHLEGLDPQLSADLLVTAGMLAGRLGNSRQLARAQVHAEALLNGAISLWKQLGLTSRVCECRSELGRCYDRQGMFDLARSNFLTSLESVSEDEIELRSRTLVRLGFSEMKLGHLHDSLTRLNEARSVAVANPSTSMFFHIEMATTLGQLAIANASKDYFKLAREHYEHGLLATDAVGHHHRTAVLECNYGYLLLGFGKFREAAARLFRARMLFDHFANRCPELDETIARLHLATRQFDLAEKAIDRAVTTLESCGDEVVLAESLITQAQVFCRLGRYREARRALNRAFELAKKCGVTEGVRLSLLRATEEMSEHLQDEERLELASAMS